MNDLKNNPQKITIAESDKVDQYEKEVDSILHALGHSEALVTDESQVSDFLMFPFPNLTKEEEQEIKVFNKSTLDELSMLLRKDVKEYHLICDLAEELHGHTKILN